jgi:peptide/nickel transport system substrate-binding protein
MDRLIANKGKLRYAFTYAKTLIGCEIVDDYTVDLIFEGPNPYCLKNMAEECIIPDEAYEKYGDDLWNKGIMYGTGPWIYKDWIEGQYVHMVKNNDYWNKAKYDPYYEEVYIRVIMEPATAVASHLAGDIQANTPLGGITNEFYPLYDQAKDRIEKVIRKSPQVFYITIQCEEGKVFHNKYARMALSYALDRDSLRKNVLDGESEPVTGIIAPSVLGFDPSLPPYEYNPEKAKEYLKKSDYDGRKFTILTFNGMKKGEDILLAIIDNLRAVGFNVEIELNEYPVFADRRSTGKYDLFYQLTMAPSLDPSETLALRIALPGEGHHYDNKEMQELIAQLMREMDADKRASYVRRISNIMREEFAPVTAIGSVNMSFYIDWGVKGVEIAKDGTVRTMYVDFDPALVPKK